MAGSTVLVSGASGGIGRATARAFAAEGARLALCCHEGIDPLESLVRELEAESVLLQGDLRDEKQVERVFAEAEKAFGRLDAIVVNAGIWIARPAPLHELCLEQWQETMESDLTSAFLTCRAYLGQLAREPGEHASIVLVGSSAALFGEAGHADYAAAKAGLAHGLTLTLKNEIVGLAPRGRVNCVCPGWVETPMTLDSLRDRELVERAMDTMSLRKVASSEDVARAIVFLSSDRLAGHVSGAVLPVTGGMEGRRLR
ncbi:MAG: SDR family NAD(P)-dependent oxidoreductase [Planctomycetota bacterium]